MSAAEAELRQQLHAAKMELTGVKIALEAEKRDREQAAAAFVATIEKQRAEIDRWRDSNNRLRDEMERQARLVELWKIHCAGLKTHVAEALEDISTTAHCISLAGPMNTTTLEDAWNKFDRLSVMATAALIKFRSSSTGNIVDSGNPDKPLYSK